MNFFTRIWEENRSFILVSGAAFALFLILNSCVSSYAGRVDGPKGLHAKAAGLEKNVRRLHKELGQYHVVRGLIEGYEREEESLRGELELPAEKELEAFDAAAPLIQFEKAIDRVWGQALDRANRAGVAIPEKLGPQDFGVGRQDGKAEYERHYAYLGIVRRALDTLIASGLEEIGRPDLVEADILPVLPDDETMYCHFRAVRFRVSGPFQSFAKTLQAVQAPGDFLQVRVADMGPRGRGEEEAVKGELVFVAFRLVDAAALGGEQPGKRRSKAGRRY